jgi:apolipoprotein N-acyltransferase
LTAPASETDAPTRGWWALRLCGAVASGLLLGLCAWLTPPGHLGAFVALVPWLAAELAGPPPRLAGAMARGALVACTLVAVGFPWLARTFAAYSGGSAAIAWSAALTLAPLLVEPQLVVAGAALYFGRRLRLGVGTAAVFTALVYVGADWGLPRLFGDTLGTALHPSPLLRQAADLVGARGLTLLLLLVQAALVSALLQPRRAARPVLGAALLVGAWLGYGALRERSEAERMRDAPRFTAGIVQANITKYAKLAAEHGTYGAVRAILDAHFAQSRGLLEREHPDVLLWPETVYPTTFGAPRSPEGAELDQRIARLVAEGGVPLVFGAYEREGDAEYNAAFFLGKRGDGSVDFDSYRKTRLFPLSEHVPAWLDGPWARRTFPWLGTWTPGPGPATVTLTLADGRALRALPLICYEVIDAGYVAAAARRGADVIVTLSNDAWFPDDAAPRLHLAIAAFRSIETRLPQVRATNSGISGVILPSGELRALTGFDQVAAIAAAVPLPPPEWTLAVAWGDFTGPAALAAAAALLTRRVVGRRSRATASARRMRA